MKKLFCLVAGAGVLFASCGPNVGNVSLTNNCDSVSYALGTMLGQGLTGNFKQLPFDTVDAAYLYKALEISKPSEQYMNAVEPQLGEINQDILMSALREYIVNSETKMPEAQANQLLQDKSTAIRLEKDKERKAIANKNHAEGTSFMEENAKAEGVKTLPCGIQYKVLAEGKGIKPTENDQVKVNYRGTLLDGTEFDASKEGTPASMNLRGVIKGWKKVLPEMAVGSRWEVVIPDSLAYGERGAGDKIAPNAYLIFDIELVDVVKKDKK